MKIPYLSNSLDSIYNYRLLDINDRKRAFDIMLFAYIGILLFSLMSGIAFINGKIILGAWLFLFGCACFGFVAALRLKGFRSSHPYSFVLFISLGYVYLLVSGGYQNTGLFWCFLFAPMLYTLLGFGKGLIANLILIGLTLFYFWWQPNFIDAARYLPHVQSRFIIAYAGLSVVLFIQEYSRTESERNYLEKAHALEKTAHADPLTKILNRRGMNSVLNLYKVSASQNEKEAALMAIDIDYFKRVNDKFGHAVGDEILKIIAELLKNSIRNEDAVARWGGEEFLIFLTNVENTIAIKIAEKLRVAVSENREIQELLKRPLTISIGVAFRRKNESINEWLKTADRQLYAAKEKGRNCLVYMN